LEEKIWMDGIKLVPLAAEKLVLVWSRGYAPRALTHISTGVVYASPGVVKTPPWVLNETAERNQGVVKRRRHALILWQIGIKVDGLHSDQVELVVDDDGAELFGGQFEAEKVSWLASGGRLWRHGWAKRKM
jgi:hypothetical protein